MIKIKYFLIIVIIIIILCVLKVKFCIKNNYFFYEPEEINKNLLNIEKYKYDILSETLMINNDNGDNDMWTNWPEKELYYKKGQWKIYPFYAFGIWVNDNCIQCPSIYNFLKQIKGLKLATLSKLSPGMKLTAHKGWASHSNHVIRCHYGIIVPNGCYINVAENNINENKFHKQFEWLIFDDSKTHFAENSSDDERIVLIIDVERPDHIPIGQSKVGDSKELLEIIKYYKNKNIINYN
jgi:aspartyl/asparaginyl beta-hydroxylase (cupin superfamily)